MSWTDSDRLPQCCHHLLTTNPDTSTSFPRYRKVPEGGFKPNPLSGVTLLGLTATVASDIAFTAKLTAMIGSGVDFARDLVGKLTHT
jgi:hypothetical protein